jgi:hypothetical protein
MDATMKVIDLGGGAWVELWHNCLFTVFADGLQVSAAANYDEASKQMADDLGYGGDTWQMSKEHELSHHIVAMLQGHPYSRVLRGVAVRAAGGDKETVISAADSAEEEALVLDFQRFYRRGISSPRLESSGIDLETAAALLRRATE